MKYIYLYILLISSLCAHNQHINIPVQLIQGIPYVLTVILLAGFVGKAFAPSAIGQPYIKER